MTHVYMAEIHYSPYESDYLGVFTSTEKAQQACREHHSENAPDEEFPLWEARGDSIRAETAMQAYTVLALELDRRVL